MGQSLGTSSVQTFDVQANLEFQIRWGTEDAL